MRTLICLALAGCSGVSVLLGDGELVWSTQGDDAAIVRMAHTGGEAEVVANAEAPESLAVDDDFVYWSDRGEIRRVPR